MSKKCLNHEWVPTVDGSVCRNCLDIMDVHLIYTHCKFQPRNDCILVRTCNLGKVGSIIMPDIAVGGKTLVVVAVGPDITDLIPGDTVLVTGQVGDDYYPLPDSKDLMVFHQKNIVLKTGHVDDSIRYKPRSALEV